MEDGILTASIEMIDDSYIVEVLINIFACYLFVCLACTKDINVISSLIYQNTFGAS